MATTITDRLSGSPTPAGAPTDLAAIEQLTGTGVPERTGTNEWSLRPVSGADGAWSPQSAGETSAWTQVAGDSFDTANGHKFLCHCVVDDDGASVLIVQAYQ